jgi:hypothetical protein
MRGIKTRKPAAPVFNPYVMNQIALMRPRYDEKIPADHLLWTVNKVVENLNVDHYSISMPAKVIFFRIKISCDKIHVVGK